jgi:hypothetical protein
LKIDLPKFAIDWAKRLGCSLNTLVPLRGGMNSLVYQCSAANTSFVIKGYAQNRTSDHDRFTSEVQFLTYAQIAANEFVPKLLQADVESRCIVLEFLEGDAYEEGSTPSAEDIAKALDFVRAMNADRLAARNAISCRAADGFLFLTEHLADIELRIKQMAFEHLHVSLSDEAKTLIAQLKAKHQELQKNTSRGILTGAVTDALTPDQTCLSPSDFGFHNAIRTSKGVRFIDFEFAGWDDPSKAVIDFDLQPRVPLTPKVRHLRWAIPWWGPRHDDRSVALYPILRLKWACIVASPLVHDRYKTLIRGHTISSAAEHVQAKIRLAHTFLH